MWQAWLWTHPRKHVKLSYANMTKERYLLYTITNA